MQTNAAGGSRERLRILNQCNLMYRADIARQTAHLLSTLSDHDLPSRVQEIASSFEARFGVRDMVAFLELLGQSLEIRGGTQAALTVRGEVSRYLPRKRSRNRSKEK